MVKKLTVGFHLDKRHVGLVLYLSEFRTKRRRQFRLLGFLLQNGTVISMNSIEHRLIDDSQHLVINTLATGFQRLDSRFQRVGCYTGLYLGVLQLCFHQLTIGLLCGGLVHNLLKHLRHRLGQVFFLCLIYFFP